MSLKKCMWRTRSDKGTEGLGVKQARYYVYCPVTDDILENV